MDMILDNVDLFVFDSNLNLAYEEFTGDTIPLEKIKTPYRLPVFNPELEKNTAYTFLFRIRSNSVKTLRIVAEEESEFYKRDSVERNYYPLFLIIAGISLFFNFILFLKTRSILPIWYSLFLICLTFYIACYEGYLYYYIMNRYPYWEGKAVFIFSLGTGTSACLFLKKLMLIRIHSAALDYFMNAIIAMYVICICNLFYYRIDIYYYEAIIRIIF